MKTRQVVSILGLLALASGNVTGAPLGTAFTYQGQLTAGGAPANGFYDLTFRLYDADSGGSQIGSTITNTAVGVSNGLFTVTLDFGGGVFTGQARWLEIAVRTNGVGAFTTLSPRQPLTPSPYALYAPSAGAAATAISANSATTVAPNGVANTSLQANAVTSDKIADGTITPADLSRVVLSNTFWRLNGNSGTTPGTHFVGTTDNQPLELRVNGLPALRLEPRPTSPNVIGGFSGNRVAAGSDGAVIGGGGGPEFTNAISAHYGTIGGGWENTIESGANSATISGGTGNQVLSGAAYATVGGGIANQIGTNAIGATIAGGDGSKIGPRSSQATIAGGNDNDIEEDAPGAFVGGGEENTIQNHATHAVLAGGERNSIHAGAQHAVIGGGQRNWIGSNALTATIAGGHENHVSPGAQSATIGGGSNNYIDTNAFWATIAGGAGHTIELDARMATISGGSGNEIHSGATGASIGGGQENFIRSDARYATIGGGAANTVEDHATHAVLAGGERNRISSDAYHSVVGGGRANTVGGEAAMVGGGTENAASGLQATVAGGYRNTASGDFSTVPGGRHNLAGGASAFAAGQKAEARHDGAFVWADSTDESFRSTGTNQFLIRASGGVGINTNAPQSALHVAGTVTAENFRGPGAGLVGVDADRLDGRDSTDFALATHAHNAGDISAGTLADARLSPNIPRLNAPANFTATLSAPVLQATNLVADVSSLNNAALTPGLVLGGSSSGEGLASKRTAGGNQYGLDLFTAFTSRLAIANNGAIHIGAGNAFTTYGDARSSIYVLRGTSSGASYTELFLPGNQRLSVPLNATWTFRAFVTGRASNGKAAGYCFRGFLENESGTVRLLETVNTEDYAEDDTAWDANLAADDSYDALVITARGNTGDSVRWVAVIYTVEVKW